MNAIFDLFSGLYDLISGAFGYLTSLVEDIVYFFEVLQETVGFSIEVVAFLPLTAVTLFEVFLLILIVLRILGRV